MILTRAILYNIKRLVSVMMIVVILPSISVLAQKSPQFSQYLECQEAMNPASVAVDDKMSVGGIYRLQWAGFKDAPRNFLLNLSYPMKIGSSRQGLGIMFLRDDVGLITNQSVLLQYSYRIKLLEGDLSLGLNVGFISHTFDKDEVDLTGGEGEMMSGDEYHKGSDSFIDAMEAEENSDVVFDVSFGCMYRTDRYFAGLSVLHLTASKVDLGSEKYQPYIPRCFYAAGGYIFKTHKEGLTVTPSGQVWTDLSTWQAELSGTLEYNKRVRGGLSYRFGDAFVFRFGVDVIPGLKLGYSYDLPTSKMIRSGGSHEVSLRYSFKPQFAKKDKYKSERIL